MKPIADKRSTFRTDFVCTIFQPANHTRRKPSHVARTIFPLFSCSCVFVKIACEMWKNDFHAFRKKTYLFPNKTAFTCLRSSVPHNIFVLFNLSYYRKFCLFPGQRTQSNTQLGVSWRAGARVTTHLLLPSTRTRSWKHSLLLRAASNSFFV